MRSRGVALAAGLVAALAATASLTSVLGATNPSALPAGLAVAAGAESSALYCTGLSDATGAVQGVVTFLNTEPASRTVTVTIVSDTGHHASATLHLAGHTRASLAPEQLVTGHSFGVSAVVDGGGVVADELTASRSSVVPCPGAGVTAWYGSGLDTSVGSGAALSFYNPTATPAVVNVTANTPSGFVAPAPFQGLPVAAHAEVVLNLGGQIVNTRDVGVRVNVVRGTLVIAGVEDSGTVGSIDVGALAPATTAWFPRVTTADQALAEVRVANPGATVVTVNVHVALGAFHVPDQTLSVAPYAATTVTITPNSAIPAAGYAVVTLSASAPVVATLATGTGAGVSLTPAPTPGTLFLLADLGTGYASATITNTSGRPVTVNFPRAFTVREVGVVAGAAIAAAPGRARLAPHATVDLLGVDAGVTSLAHTAVEVTAAHPVIVVSATLATTPVGLSVVVPSGGG
ncbi:MAG: DUF5719 family protein [Acidimicrobiales bacterium]